MLELDNWDVDFDFVTDPLSEINSFESSFSSSIPNKEKSIERTDSGSKPAKSSEGFVKAGIHPAGGSDCGQKSKQNEEIFMKKKFEVVAKSTSSFPSGSVNFINVTKFDKNEFNTLNDSSSNKRILLQRKFPGPAGLLPDKPLKGLSGMNIIIDDSAESFNFERQMEFVILCSQSASVSSEASFKKLASDFDLFGENCPLNKYNIAWVKKKAFQKSLNGKRVPFLAVVLNHLDDSTPDPVLRLMDQTGEIYGILHREVWSGLGEKLHPGAALALRQVGVLANWVSKRQIYLNITVNNILNIYSYCDKDVLERSCINELKESDLKNDIELWQSGTSLSKIISPPKPFCTVVGNRADHTSTFSLKDAKCNARSKTHENKNDSYPKNVCPGNILQGNRLSNELLADDDSTDFMNFFDDDSFFGEFFKEAKGSDCDFNGIPKSEQREEGNGRKRKIETGDENASSKEEGSQCKNNSSLPPAKLGKMNCQEIFTRSNKVENQITGDALDGIDFDDFNDFDDFEIQRIA